jgi:phage terminase large subunit-like protein
MAKAKKLDPVIIKAIRAGIVPVLRDIDNLPIEKLTRGERLVRFAHEFLVVPEGLKVGQPLRLEPFQIAFLLAVFDNPAVTRRAIMSIARRNGKTFLVAVILLSFILGPEALPNSTLASAAMSRDQAALVFNLMSKMLMLSPKLEGLYRVIPSSKRIVGLRKNVEYSALASDAKTGHGKSLAVVLLDEAGQIKGSHSDFVDMLISSQGSYSTPLMLTISTQAPEDSDLLSTWIDDATTGADPRTVCHVYEVAKDAELLDETSWKFANPGLGIFRSIDDMRQQAETASRLPAQESGFRNLLLNQRVALNGAAISATLWKENNGAPDPSLLHKHDVHLGLDLSRRDDLTAAVAAVQDDDGFVHLFPFVFSPQSTLEDRAKRDRAPYVEWVRAGQMIAVPGKVLDYEWVASYLREQLKGAAVASLQFDRWGIDDFKRDAASVDFFYGGNYVPVGQGFKDMGPRIAKFMELLLHGKIRHGGHPLLTMAASNAIAVQDPTGAIKLDKSKSTQKIDPIIAAVMAAYGATSADRVSSVEDWII